MKALNMFHTSLFDRQCMDHSDRNRIIVFFCALVSTSNFMIRESFDESYQEKTKVFRKHLAILKFLFKIFQFKFLSHDREKHFCFLSLNISDIFSVKTGTPLPKQPL